MKGERRKRKGKEEEKREEGGGGGGEARSRALMVNITARPTN